MQSTWHIGLTGGIGSGKSTFCQMLVHHGACAIDADALSRATTAAGGIAIEPIRRTFGAQYIGVDGALDRQAMRDLVFQQPAARQQLEAIVHPLVWQQTRAAANAAVQRGERVIVYDIPLLVESGHWRKRLQQVLVVDCDTETQITRVMQRSQLSREAVSAIIANQATRAQRAAAADIVVDNSRHATLETLQRQAEALARYFGLIIGPKGTPA